MKKGGLLSRFFYDSKFYYANSDVEKGEVWHQTVEELIVAPY